jgi:hypothetical protein
MVQKSTFRLRKTGTGIVGEIVAIIQEGVQLTSSEVEAIDPAGCDALHMMTIRPAAKCSTSHTTGHTRGGPRSGNAVVAGKLMMMTMYM